MLNGIANVVSDKLLLTNLCSVGTRCSCHILKMLFFPLLCAFLDFVQSCEYLTVDHGTEIFSPKYPEEYPADTEQCLVMTSVDSAVNITFSKFDTESSFDYLVIYDGPSIGSTQLVTLSGSQDGYTTQSSGLEMTIIFYSDGTTEGAGFLACACASSTDSPCDCEEDEEKEEEGGFPAIVAVGIAVGIIFVVGACAFYHWHKKNAASKSAVTPTTPADVPPVEENGAPTDTTTPSVPAEPTSEISAPKPLLSASANPPPYLYASAVCLPGTAELPPDVYTTPDPVPRSARLPPDVHRRSNSLPGPRQILPDLYSGSNALRRPMRVPNHVYAGPNSVPRPDELPSLLRAFPPPSYALATKQKDPV